MTRAEKNETPSSVIALRTSPLPCPENLDPLVKKAYHNVAVNLFCRIPDDILYLIMDHLDVLSLNCLRRTSRIFLRLFEKHSVRGYRTHGRPWQCIAYVPYNYTKDMRARISADKYCAACDVMRYRSHHTSRGAELYRRDMYCNGCIDIHSIGLFSAHERVQRDVARRVCIAHEGHMRVCEHRVVTWADIERWSGYLQCKSHSYRVVLCSAENHLSKCDSSEEGAMDDGIAIKLQLVEVGKISVEIQWDVHVRVPHGEGPKGIYDAADVRRIAEELQSRTGQYIVPRFQPDEPPHMAAFDPNFCSCLTYAGRGSLDWQMAPRKNLNYKCCRKDGSRSLFLPSRGTLGARLKLPRAGRVTHTAKYEVKQPGRTSRTFTIDFKRCCPRKDGMGVVVSHRHYFELSCGPAGWPSSARPVARVPPEWYRIMEPASYGLEGDEESRHLLWCPKRGCANHVGSGVAADRFRDVASLKGPIRPWREEFR